MHEAIVVADLARSLLGRRLAAVTEARHWFGGKRSDDARSLLHVWLNFEGAPTVHAHPHGDVLVWDHAEPHDSYDMQQYGETRVAPARSPDLLASVVGQILNDAALIQDHSPLSNVAGILLRFEHESVVIASLADEWVLARDAVPSRLRRYLSVGRWLSLTV